MSLWFSSQNEQEDGRRVSIEVYAMLPIKGPPPPTAIYIIEATVNPVTSQGFTVKLYGRHSEKKLVCFWDEIEGYPFKTAFSALSHGKRELGKEIFDAFMTR